MITLRTEPTFGLANKVLYHPLRVELFPEFHFRCSQFETTLVSLRVAVSCIGCEAVLVNVEYRQYLPGRRKRSG